MDNTKDAEVRARVTREMFNALSQQADGRGEQLPVIVREALAEYLAKRIAGGGNPPERELVLQALHDKPEVIEALLSLAKALGEAKPSSRASKTGTRDKVREALQQDLAPKRTVRPKGEK